MKHAAEVLRAAVPTLEKTDVTHRPGAAGPGRNQLPDHRGGGGRTGRRWSTRPTAGCTSTARRWPPKSGKRGQVRFPGTARRVLRRNRTCPLFPSPHSRTHPQVPQAVRPFPRQRSEPSRPRLRQARFRADHEGPGRDRLSRLGLGRARRLHPRRRATGAGKHRVFAPLCREDRETPLIVALRRRRLARAFSEPSASRGRCYWEAQRHRSTECGVTCCARRRAWPECGSAKAASLAS